MYPPQEPEPERKPPWALLCGTGFPDGVSVVATDGGSVTFAMHFGNDFQDFKWVDGGPMSLTLDQTYTHEGGGDVIVARLASDGTLEWSQHWGGPGMISVSGAAMPDGRAVFFGEFSGVTTIDGTAVGCDLPCSGLVVVVLNSDGSLAWHRLITTTLDLFDSNNFFMLRTARPAIGPAGEVVVAGMMRTTLDFGDVELSPQIAYNGFVAAFESDGTLRFARRHNSYRSTVDAVAVASDGGVLITGEMYGPFSFPSCNVPYNGDGPLKLGGYLAKLTPQGECAWGTGFRMETLTTDPATNIFATRGPDIYKFDPLGNQLWKLGFPFSTQARRVVGADRLQVARWDGVTVRLQAISGLGEPLWTQLFELPPMYTAEIDENGATVVGGGFDQEIDLFGPYTPVGMTDIWVSRVVPEP